jgi:hypothetical protein
LRTCEGDLIGFVYLAWDGGIHAFILDPIAPGQSRPRRLN